MQKTENKSIASVPLMGGAFLIGFAAYLAVFNISPATTITEPTFTTVRLSQCHNSTATNATLVEDLQIGHNQLGFAASELIAIARPLERVFNMTNEARQNSTMNNTTKSFFPELWNKTTNFTNTTFDALYNTTANVTELLQKEGVNATIANMSANATDYWKNSNFNNTAAAVQNITKDAMVNATNCAKTQSLALVNNATTVMENVYEDMTKTQLRTALDLEWAKRMDGPKSGALRFSVNDAVAQMKGIFSACSIVNATQDNDDAILRRFPGAKFTQVAMNKTSMTTMVADGWQMESRVVNDLWTNVTVSRGEFHFTLKRDKFGLIHAYANGVRMGEI